MMRRRDFMLTAALAAASPTFLRAQTDNRPDDLRITRITAFDLPLQRSKLVGRNARLGVHGDTSTDPMVLIETNAGLTGLGHRRVGRDAFAQLLGEDPLAGLQMDPPRFDSPLGPGTMPLWDLAGKALDKPVCDLLGGSPGSVRVYDGSIYFADLLPPYRDRWRDRFREEIDMGLDHGHRAFKVKIGRGHKWMDQEPGDRRDVEVLRVIRDHAGAEVTIGVDANNGYTLGRTKRLLQRLPDLGFAFMEEMFPEDVDQYLELRRFLEDNGRDILIADGETQNAIDPLRPLMEAGAVDVYQLDMRLMGIEGILREAEACRPHGGRVAPHNWGSLIGYYMQLHVGRALDNFYMAEHDPLSHDALVAEGYRIADGRGTLPDAPGFGLTIDRQWLENRAEIRYQLEAD